MRNCCFPIFPEKYFSVLIGIRIFRRSRYEMRVFSDFRAKKFRSDDDRIFLYRGSVSASRIKIWKKF